MTELPKLGISGRIARAFQTSQITPLLALAGLLLGIAATIITPKEEDPQIEVTMANVMVPYPGASVRSVENLVAFPLEQKLSEIGGIKHVYSVSRPGMAVITVQFEVGVPRQQALVSLYNKIYSNADWAPPGLGLGQPLVKPYGIDDVPMMAVTLWSDRADLGALQLAKVAHTLETDLKRIPGTRDVYTIGAPDRAVMIRIDPGKLASYHLTVGDLAQALKSANVAADVGEQIGGNRDLPVRAGTLLMNAGEVSQLVIGLAGGRPVHLADVSDVVSGADYPTRMASYGTPAGRIGPLAGMAPAVTLAIAKKAGTNAHDIATLVRARLAELRDVDIPAGVHASVTRDYGLTANDKADELMLHLGLAALAVVLLVLLALGWREAVVVGTAVVVTLAITLFASWAIGFTINRVSLFALIFSIGILVDDAIVVVENIVRHFRLPESQNRSSSDVVVEAVAEVGNPTILATFAVLAAVLPMAFVRGLMGPYMRPIPVGASAAMLFSLMVAFVVSPWAALRLLGRHLGGARILEPEHENWRTRLYRRVMRPLIASPRNRYLFFAGVLLLLLISVALVPLGLVRVKMLPFDNKSELQIIVNMPDGTPLEQTERVTQALGNQLARQPEVLNYQTYAGASGPFNFNGLVRHYYMRRQPNQADIQVNLLPASERHDQSHAIARRLRPLLTQVAQPYGARIQVSEVPPGPPVLQTLVAEVYGPSLDGQIHLARQIKQIFLSTPGVVDTDWYVEDPQPRLIFRVDQVKAAENGIAVADVSRALALATSGMQVGLLHDPNAREPIPAVVEFDRPDRSSEDALENIRLPGSGGSMVSLRELVEVEHTTIQRSIYHKNLKRVVYVTGDVAGAEESPVYAILKMDKRLDQLQPPGGGKLSILNSEMPQSTDHYSMKWDGEWQITIEVFRDLGLAFAAVLVLIYVLVVGWFRSFVVPLLIMAPIPLTLIGILPAHALLGAFFTATSMIGFIAGAGIIVRNSILLVDFIELRRREGVPLAEAVIDAGAIRFRPMLLTAAAVVVGASVILTDPIFQGLAISLIAGAIASTFLSWPTIPILYYMVHKNRPAEIACEPQPPQPGTPQEGASQ